MEKSEGWVEGVVAAVEPITCIRSGLQILVDFSSSSSSSAGRCLYCRLFFPSSGGLLARCMVIPPPPLWSVVYIHTHSAQPPATSLLLDER